MKQDIIAQIKKEHIKPIPKWYFSLKAAFVWIFFIASFVFGVLSFGFTLSYLFDADWFLQKRIGLFLLLLKFLPLFWVLFLIGAIGLTYVFFRKQPQAYKWHIWQILPLTIGVTFLGGGAFYLAGGSTLFQQIGSHTPLGYISYLLPDREQQMISIWQNPEKGLLIGTLLICKDSCQFQDSLGTVWQLQNLDSATVLHSTQLLNGEKFKLVGKIVGEGVFEVEEIRPYQRKHN